MKCGCLVIFPVLKNLLLLNQWQDENLPSNFLNILRDKPWWKCNLTITGHWIPSFMRDEGVTLCATFSTVWGTNVRLTKFVSTIVYSCHYTILSVKSLVVILYVSVKHSLHLLFASTMPRSLFHLCVLYQYLSNTALSFLQCRIQHQVNYSFHPFYLKCSLSQLKLYFQGQNLLLSSLYIYIYKKL